MASPRFSFVCTFGQIRYMDSKSSSSFSNWFYFIGTVLFSGIVLNLGSTLFVPLGFAFFISIVVYPVCRTLESKGLRRDMAILTGLLLVILFFLMLIFIFGLQLQRIIAEWPTIQVKLTELLFAVETYLAGRFGLTTEEIAAWLKESMNNTLGGSMGMLGNTIQNLVVNLAIIALIPIYAFLILFYRRRLVGILYILLPGYERQRITEVIQLSIHTYFKFIKGMLIVYAIVGTLNSVGLWLMGVPYPFLFGYLTAVMTFIPYVGIIIASILPITYAWITYGVIWYPLGVVALFAFVQYLEANIIFPWAVGQRLELNTLATLIVIVLGGIIWGASGMILFIPFAAILKLISDRIPEWGAMSRFLGNTDSSEDGVPGNG